MSKKMFFNQDRGQWLSKLITSIVIISLICFIIADVVGIVCLFSNPNLPKTIFGIVLFCPAIFLLLLALVFVLYGGFHWRFDPENGAKNSPKIIINASLASLVPGIFILLSDLTLLKVPFGIHLLFSYSFLLLTPFGLKVFERGWLAIPEKDRNALFIAWFIPLLEQIIPKQDHEEWMGLLKIGHDKSIKEGKHLIFVNLETLKNGLCLIGGSLWLKADKFVSGWMTRAK